MAAQVPGPEDPARAGFRVVQLFLDFPAVAAAKADLGHAVLEVRRGDRDCHRDIRGEHAVDPVVQSVGRYPFHERNLVRTRLRRCRGSLTVLSDDAVSIDRRGSATNTLTASPPPGCADGYVFLPNTTSSRRRPDRNRLPRRLRTPACAAADASRT